MAAALSLDPLIDSLAPRLTKRDVRAVAAWLTTFYPFQLEWLLDWGRFSLLLKARQIGASHTYAAQSVLWGLGAESTTVTSVGLTEALEVLEKADKHAEVLYQLGCAPAQRVGSSARRVRLASGGRIIALPSTSGGRSFSGNVILDEFAYHQHPEKVWDGAAATVMHGKRLRVLSTPNGSGNLFHELCTNPKANKGYVQHAVKLANARAQGLAVSDEECWKMARGDARVYDQLFNCVFLDNDQQYIPSHLIEAARAPAEQILLWEGDTFGGLDIGRVNDRTSLYIIRVFEELRRIKDSNEALRIRHAFVQTSDTKSRTSLEDIESLVEHAIEYWHVRRLCVDATGLGIFPVEQLQKKFGQLRIEGVTFTNDSKEELATTLYSAFADRTVKILDTDDELRSDLQSLRRIVTPAGNVRYDAPTTERGHADRAWALALALHAAGMVPGGREELIAA